MKTIFLSIFSVFFLTALSAQDKQTVRVWGNCGMCKSTIEKAAKGAGAADASWNKETKILTVSGKTDMRTVEQAVAAAGYDTQNFTARDEDYVKLPECCQYERKKAGVTEAKMADCCKNGTCGKGKQGKACEKCAGCEKCSKGECADCCKDGKCSSGKDCCKK
jgi:mercuric ion binding protein